MVAESSWWFLYFGGVCNGRTPGGLPNMVIVSLHSCRGRPGLVVELRNRVFFQKLCCVVFIDSAAARSC